MTNAEVKRGSKGCTDRWESGVCFLESLRIE